MNGWLIDKSAVRRALLSEARQSRYYYREAEQVAQSALQRVNAATVNAIRREIQALPSAGGGRRIK